MKEKLDAQEAVASTVLLCETYAVEGERLLKLPDVTHLLRGNGVHDQIRLMVFDIAEVNGAIVNNDYWWRLGELEQWLKDARLCHAARAIKPKVEEDIVSFWNYWMRRGAEGVFARSPNGLFKVKQLLTLDCALIGINVDKPEWRRTGRITSLKLGLMTKDGELVETGDCSSGITYDLRVTLRKLLDFKVKQTSNTIYVKPIIVVEVQINDAYPKEQPVFDVNFNVVKRIQAFTLRHPRLVRFRGDKRPTYPDIRLDQLTVCI